MRTRFVIAAASIAGAAALGVVLAACGDLFHGTDDIKNLCELEAGVEGCGVDAATVDTGRETAAPDAGFDLCATDSVAAKQRAAAACKWLGACETPVGRNRFAECMVGALETYDCTIAPNRRPKGAAAAYWSCLAQADSCEKVDRCLFPSLFGNCNGGTGFTACDSKNPTVREYCAVPVNSRGESCAAFGQTCYSPGSFGFCGGEREDGGACTSGCFVTSLHDCDDAGVNVGVDCKAYGAQACVSTGGVLGCKAEFGATCAPTTAVTCTNGVARGCPSGVTETIACRTLTGLAHCDVSSPGALWDVSRVCFDNANSDPCAASPDSCAGRTMSSCVGGATYTTTCDAPFAGCSTSPTVLGAASARCVITGR